MEIEIIRLGPLRPRHHQTLIVAAPRLPWMPLSSSKVSSVKMSHAICCMIEPTFSSDWARQGLLLIDGCMYGQFDDQMAQFLLTIVYLSDTEITQSTCFK